MKTLKGIVTKDKMNKTVVVTVSTLWQHPIYKKRIKKSKRFHVHNELQAKVGDKVVIAQSRPLSRLKRFIITKIVK